MGNLDIAVDKSNGSPELQKIWAIICGNFQSFQSVWLIWVYFVAGSSPTLSNVIAIF